jgi:hypothetical protein
MMRTLPEILLGLAACAKGDGGAGVRHFLHGALSEASPFDAAEIVLRRGDLLAQARLEGGHSFLGRDLLDHLLDRDTPFRIDDLSEAAAFPEGRARLEAEGLRSLLALPSRFEDGLAGAVVVARRYGWAFVGTSLPVMLPLAAMAVLALDRALALSKPSEDGTGFAPDVEALQARIAGLEARLREAQEKLAAIQAGTIPGTNG